MLLNLVFARNTISSCFFFFFLIIDLYCLIPAATAQISNPIAELVIPIEKPSEEAKAEIEIDPVFVEVEDEKVFNTIRSCANHFLLSTDEFILLYFFKKTISCFIYSFLNLNLGS